MSGLFLPALLGRETQAFCLSRKDVFVYGLSSGNVILALDLNLSCKNIMAGHTPVVQVSDSGSVAVPTSATSQQGSTCQTDEV